VIAFARADSEACVQIFFVRAGKLIGREYFVLEGTEDESGAEIVEQFVKQFYAEAAYIPAEVLLPQEVEEARIIKEWLNTKRGGEKVTLTVPRRGTKNDLVAMAADTATETLASLRAQWAAIAPALTVALIPVLLLGWFPWTPLLLPALARGRTVAPDGPAFRTARWALAGWLLPPLALVSLSGSKLATYVLPLFPGVALWMAHRLLARNSRGRALTTAVTCL
jgi:4-amino-4-deoxy-L-arabinose transferase-like glycosyltransferase